MPRSDRRGSFRRPVGQVPRIRSAPRGRHRTSRSKHDCKRRSRRLRRARVSRKRQREMPSRSSHEHSEADSVPADVLEQPGVRVRLRVLPVVLPDWKRLNVDTGLQQYVIGDIGHRQFGIDELASMTTQQHGDVRITVRTIAAARGCQTVLRRLPGIEQPPAQKTRWLLLRYRYQQLHRASCS